MIEELSTWQWVVLMWFMCSVLVEVLSTLMFSVWLRRRNVELIFGMIGIPGYLEYQYAQWCRANSRPSRAWLAVRGLLMVNVILSLVVAFPLFVGG